MKTQRILIINPFGIGDVLFATPLVRALRERFPHSFIGFICNKHTYPILAANKNLNEVFIFEKGDYRYLWRKSRVACLREFFRFLKLIKSRRFDLAIDLSLGHQYGFFLMLLGVPTRMGYNFRGRGRFLTHKIEIDGYRDKPVVEYYLDLFDFLCRRAAVEVHRVSDRHLDIFIKDEDLGRADAFLSENGITPDDRLLGVIPGAGASWGSTAGYKRWPAKNFARVADELVDKYGLKIILFGSQTEIDLCDVVRESMHNRALFACGKTDLLEFAALLKRCFLVLCNDGGPLHIAVAVGTKTVSIFGPVDENVYGPYPPSSKHIVVKTDVDCRPCYRGFKFQKCSDRHCLLNVKPQKVADAAVKLLN